MKKILILVFVLALHQAGQSQISYGAKAGVRYSRDLSKMNKQNVGGGNLTGSVIAISVQYQLSK